MDRKQITTDAMREIENPQPGTHAMSIEIPMPLDAPNPQPSAEVSLLDLLLVLARRRRDLLLGTIAVAVAAAIISFLLPNRFTATTVILPPQQTSSSAVALLGQLGNISPLASLAGGTLGLKNPNDLQVAMLKSRTVEDAMVARFNLMALYHEPRLSEARKAFEKYTDIENGLKDGLIRISVTDKNPNRAAEMANAYVEEYKKLSAGIAVTEASQRRLFFEQQLVQAKDNLVNAEDALKQTEQKTGLIQLDGQARAVIASVAQLRGQVAAKEVQIRAMRQFAAEQNPDLLLAEQELAGLQSQLARMGAGAGAAGDFLMPKGSVPAAGLDYVRKLRDVKYHETIFEMLAKQFEIAKIDEARQGAVVQVVDKAVVPDKKSSPRRLLMIGCCTAAGFLLAVFWVLFSEAIRIARRDPRQREQLDGLARSFGRT
ncbi:MAG TPA: GNVR domain-containing protein [Candidatus Sulfotelmatobacter sp.]|nr:GNVR domain-containing protein [Candidatus Sulfotelmatobacter sp.]